MQQSARGPCQAERSGDDLTFPVPTSNCCSVHKTPPSLLRKRHGLPLQVESIGSDIVERVFELMARRMQYGIHPSIRASCRSSCYTLAFV